MNKLQQSLFVVFLCLVAGCYLGDPIAQRTVALRLPPPPDGTNLTLSITDPEIKEALRIIDDVFVANGLIRDKIPPSPEDRAQGIIVAYGRYSVSLKPQ